MEPHSLYRPPSEERLSPGQQPPSPCVKGSQRVVTLAQHISVGSTGSHTLLAPVAEPERRSENGAHPAEFSLTTTQLVFVFVHESHKDL